MAEHLSEQSIERYQRRELPPAELLAVDDHLSTCDECYQRVRPGREYSQAALNHIAEGIPAGPTSRDDHLTYEQLAALVDSELDDVDREIANVHLEVCRQCAEELHGLQELNEPSPAPFREPRPRRTRGRLDEIISLWRQPAWAWPRLAAVALVVLIAAAFVWTIWRTTRQPSLEVAKVTPPLTSASPGPSVTSSIHPSPTPASAPQVLIALNDAGGQVMLDKAGNISGLNALSPSSSASVRNALTTQQLNIAPALEGLRGKNGTLMGAAGDGAPFALLNPVGTVVRSNPPTFHWRPLRGATAYVVKVYEINFNEVATSPAQPRTDWTVGAALPRGMIYLWQVTAIKNGEEIKSPVPPAPEARFRILARDKVVEIQRVEKTQGNSHLVLGTIYAEAGLLREAQREFRLLIKANPDSPLARRLLQEVSGKLESNRTTAK